MPILLMVQNFPPTWNKPPARAQQAVEQSAKDFNVPVEVLYSVVRRESNFRPELDGYKHGGNSERFARSYAKYKDQIIPGKNPNQLTWGDMFPTPESWRPRGLTQIMPYHIVGKTGGVKPGAPLKELYDVWKTIRMAAAYLAALYAKHGDWFAVLKQYNGASSYAREVTEYAAELALLNPGIVVS